ncbi:4-alpha-glucanotransferase [Giardia muris]|uniref:4-alpha-glucanotransferase n=1 Tax=Giardia muris TaxID=5742 RepID=A0A4Z1SRF9_GIAMU|nr:4-alpha-glucanotransferase [Giardia muris]|eukprot:TNJ28446.1 4-alpha-glucanotransferase [Giardia muris]
MEHRLVVVLHFTLRNYVAQPDDRIAIRTSLHGEEPFPLEQKGGQWDGVLDITTHLSAATASDTYHYRYVLIRKDGSQELDVLERSLPLFPTLGDMHQQCISALVLHPSYETLVGKKDNTLKLTFEFVDDWSLNGRLPWNKSSMQIILDNSRAVSPSSLVNKDLVTRIFSRCFWKIDDALDTSDHVTQALLDESRGGRGKGKLSILKASKLVKNAELRRQSPRSNVLHSNLVPVLFTCVVPYITRKERVVLTGNLPRFGSWNPNSRSSIPMVHVGNRRFEAPTIFHLTHEEAQSFQFKYVIDHGNGSFSFEGGENRTLGITPIPQNEFVETVGQVLAASPLAKDRNAYTRAPRDTDSPIHIQFNAYFIDSFFRYPYNIAPRLTALLAPMFSLRSAFSTGIGDFGDLRMLADFAARCGVNIVQLLPIQDTISSPVLDRDGRNVLMAPFSHEDSNPYRTISVFALHPVYIRCDKLVPPKNERMWKRLNEFRHACTKDLSYLHCRFDYATACRGKLNFLYEVYDDQCANSSLSHVVLEIMDWITKTVVVEPWIYAYMLYRYLVDILSSASFVDEHPDVLTRSNKHLTDLFSLLNPQTRTILPSDASLYVKELVDKLKEAGKTPSAPLAKITKHIFFYGFLQMHAYTQLLKFSIYCRKRGIALKGDFFYSTTSRSLDVWQQPELFDSKFVIGAPPDAFAPSGQNLGYPALDWDYLKQTNYAWIKQRLTFFELFFDCVRLDHILSWFRTWEIPRDAHRSNGALGQFHPAAPLHWDWVYEVCLDPESPIPWCRTKEGIVDRLTKPYLKREHAHKLCNAAAGDLACRDLMDLEILELDSKTDSYVLKLSEKAAFDKLYEAFAADEITGELCTALHEALLRLVSNVCLLPDNRDPDRYCHPVFKNRDVVTEAYSLTTLEHSALRDKIRHWSNEYFRTWHDTEWSTVGYERLSKVCDATNMMICGEDLGHPHPCFTRVMNDLGILGLRVQRMPTEGHGRFYRCEDESVYSYLTVAAPSIHNIMPLRAWWETSRDVACAFWKERLGRYNDSDWQVSRTLSEFDCRAILRQNLHSKSIICCLMIQDILGSCDKYRYTGDARDEVINIPEDPNWVWKYRMHLSLEELHNSDLVGIIGDEISSAGRILE